MRDTISPKAKNASVLVVRHFLLAINRRTTHTMRTLPHTGRAQQACYVDDAWAVTVLVPGTDASAIQGSGVRVRRYEDMRMRRATIAQIGCGMLFVCLFVCFLSLHHPRHFPCPHSGDRERAAVAPDSDMCLVSSSRKRLMKPCSAWNVREVSDSVARYSVSET